MPQATRRTNTLLFFFIVIAALIIMAVAIIDTDESPSELTTFREQCIRTGSVACSWDTLKLYLENHTVSRVWWDLTRDERYSISEMAVKNVASPVVQFRSGEPNCAGGTGTWRPASCIPLAIITHQKFTYPIEDADKCYWRPYISSNEVCYVPNKQYNLPVFIVFIRPTMHENGTLEKEGHVLNAIQIQNNTDFSSFIAFQYDQFNTYFEPGRAVEIHEPTGFSCSGFSSRCIVTFSTPPQ